MTRLFPYYFVLFACVVTFLLFPTLNPSQQVFAAQFATCNSMQCRDPLSGDLQSTVATGNSSFGVLNCTPPDLGGSFCDTTNWVYYRNPTCDQVAYPICDQDYNVNAVFKCHWNYDDCNSADRCLGASRAGPGSGSNAAGDIVPGKCNEQRGCISGTSVYRICCSANGQYPKTACYDGTCPDGRITYTGVTQCITAPKCVESGKSYGECCGAGLITEVTDYDYDNGAGTCKPSITNCVDDPTGDCTPITPPPPTPPPEVPVTPPADTPPPGVTITPTSPPSLRCDQSKGQCGCVPGTGCKDGSSTDFRCCYRACDTITKQCKTIFGQGRNNTCNSDPDCKILQCNQAYGTCGCVPGTGCKDGLSTDFRCCYRTCDLAKQQCVTKFSLGKLNTNGVLNKCNNDPNCKSSRFAGHCTMSNGQNYYVVTGTSCSNCSYAKYTDGTFAWQGESIPQSSSLTHWVKSGTSFDWYVNNVKIGSGRCNTAGKSQCGQEGCISDDDCDSAYQCVDQCN